MLNLRNHFEQIPLAIVRRIIEEQVQQQEIAGRIHLVRKEKIGRGSRNEKHGGRISGRIEKDATR